MKIRKTWLAAGMLLVGAVCPARADEPLKFGSTPNPVGSGGRAVAWGGAFIAVADDATAASWNPAGLIQLETPECSVVFSYLDRRESMKVERGEATTNSEVAAHADVNYASVAYPFHIGRVNLVPSLNYQRLVEIDRSMESTYSYLNPPDALGWRETQGKVKNEQVGALTTVTPALAMQVTPKISVGVSVNFWGLEPLGDGWKTQTQQRSVDSYVKTLIPAYLGPVQRNWLEEKREFKLSGLNWNWQAGFLVKPGNFSIGGVYKAGFTANLDYDYEVDITPFPVATNPAGWMPGPPEHRSRRQELKLSWPASYGLGVAYRFSDAFSLALDVHHTEWSKFKLDRMYQYSGRLKDFNPIAPDGSVVRDTTQVRAGMEYLIIKPKAVVALRGGGFYDPEPRADKQQAEFYGITLGTGFGMGHFVADFAYQFRFGQNVLVDNSDNTIGEIRADAFERFAVASLIYHF